MPTVPFCHDGWNFLDFPPYAGQWWAVTRHRTVELVDVEPKDPDLLGYADPADPAHDPYFYTFGEGSSVHGETVAKRRWTHWQPVLRPEPPLDFDPVAAGLADPTPGPRGPSAKDLLREHLAKELDQLDREDASAYKPIDLPFHPPGTDPMTAGPGAGADPMTPIDLMARVRLLAAYIIGLGGAAREREYARLKAANPVVFTLLRACVNEARRESGGDRAA